MEGHLSIGTRSISFLALISACVIGFWSTNALAEDSEDIIGFDSIVEQLNKESAPPAPVTRYRRANITTNDPFESVWIHFGVGMTGSMQTINLSDGRDLFINQRGVQAALGIDLFSPHLMAETTARSFSESTNRENGKVSLMEFDLKVIYKNKFSRQLGYKAGVGLTARYLNLTLPQEEKISFTTPAALAILGMDFFLTDRFSVGTELSARNSMIGETLDRVSYDATLRMDTHF